MVITFADPDPVVAAAGVTAITNVFERTYKAKETEWQQKQLKAMEEQGAELGNKIQSIQEHLAQQQGTSGDVSPEYNAVSQRANDLLVRRDAAREMLMLAENEAAGEHRDEHEWHR